MDGSRSQSQDTTLLVRFMEVPSCGLILTCVAGKWAVDDLIAADGFQDITIPKCIANGQYLLRAEVVALHSAGGLGSAQFYMECAQINVSGGTGGSPSTVSFPGAYSV